MRESRGRDRVEGAGDIGLRGRDMSNKKYEFRIIKFIISFMLIIQASCVAGDQGGESGTVDNHPAPGSDALNLDTHVELPELYRVEDINADPNIIEFNLEASVGDFEFINGKPSMVYMYNNQFPGPVIEGQVGDTVIIHFTNSLPEPTTIHWHGLVLPSAMDGTEVVQNPVKPGGTFDYLFKLLNTGLYWYHPHVNSSVQLTMGLYAPIIIRDENEPEFDRERILVLSDALIDEDGRLVPPSEVTDPQTLMTGYRGNRLLVNGALEPWIQMREGTRERWRVLNAANSRFFRLSLPGYKLILIGTDGGLIERPRELEEILLTPGERVDLIVEAAGEPSGQFALMNLPYERGHNTGAEPETPLLNIQYVGGAAVDAGPVPDKLADIEELPEPVRAREFRLSESMGGEGEQGSMGAMEMGHEMGSHNMDMDMEMDEPSDEENGETMSVMAPEFYINGESWPDIPEFDVQFGETEIWEFINLSEMDHPMHVHGVRFQILTRNGQPEPYRAWKDTFNVRANETVRIKVRFDGYPGGWMYHCHILPHAEQGMMAVFTLKE